MGSTKRAGLCLGFVVGSAVFGNLLCRVVSGRWVPTAALLLALVYGGLSALSAIGLVLVYRSGRIVNFAQGAIGGIAAVLFLMLSTVKGWNFFLALPLALAASAAVGGVAEVALVRRLSKAPRLALTVVTIGLGQVLLAGTAILPIFFLRDLEDLPTRGLQTPFSRFEFAISPLVFTGNHIMVVVVSLAAMGGLATFFRLSSAGIAVRGAAENDDRAELLGVNVANLSSLVWILAAALAGLSSILELAIAPTTFGAQQIGAASVGALVAALGAAVVGRMENLPVTVSAAIGIAILRQSMFWAFDDTALIDGGLLVLIVVVLMVQRPQATRGGDVGGSWAASEEVRPVPAELRDLTQVRTGLRRGRMALVVAALAFPWVMSPTQTAQGQIFLIYGIVVVSIVVLTGWGGQISLGQFAFVAMGALIGSSLTSRAHLPFLIALVLASLVGAGIAVVVGLPAMRITGLFLAVTTLSFALAVASVVLNQRYFGWLQPAAISRPKFLFLDGEDERVYFYLCVAALMFSLWLASGLRRSRAGRVLIAMRENERTAQSFSINRVKTRLATFAISGFMASFAGVLLAHQQHSVRAAAFTPDQSVQLFLLAVIGGLGSVPGALMGVAYIAAVNIFVPGTTGQLLASGGGVILVLLFYPTGLGGLVFAGRDAWLRRVAMRQGIYVASLMGNLRTVGEGARAALAPKYASSSGPADLDVQDRAVVPVRYRIPSAIGVRGESQQAHGWRWQK